MLKSNIKFPPAKHLPYWQRKWRCSICSG